MKSCFVIPLALCLAACASPSTEEALRLAEAQVQQTAQNPQAQRAAPKDVARALDSLQRAQRLSGYLGNAEDARHYAYLAQRYAQIAEAQAEVAQNLQRLSVLELEQQRLRLTLGESRQAGERQRSAWLGAQMDEALAGAGEEALVMELGAGLFAPASAEPDPVVKRSLARLAGFLAQHASRRLRIEGYADARSDGGTAAALAISQARAQAIAAQLHALGLAAERIEVAGLGSAFPVAESASAQGRERNRRVEVVVSSEDGSLPPVR